MKIKQNAADRNPNDGRPFYCKTCGLGYAEYLACDALACQLEDESEAKLRQVRAA